MRNRWWIGLSLTAAAALLTACGSNSSAADPAASGPTASAIAQTNAGAGPVAIKKMHTSKGIVLVNADGFTLYWFAKDTAKKSNCNGSCATYWQPVIGTAVAAAGTSLRHGFGTIKRANGQTQATYDGHPLYTYTGDAATGQVNGNDLNASGGLWWAATPSGAKLRPHPAPASSSSGGSGSGGW